MTYNDVVKAKFISRPNRFIANVELDGKKLVVHVKNTGRSSGVVSWMQDYT